MLKLNIIFFLLFSTFPDQSAMKEISAKENNSTTIEAYISDLYSELNDSTLSREAFEYGIIGHAELSLKNKLTNDRYLTIIDMSLSCNEERMYIIDVIDRKLVKKSLVAHGVNTGDEFARHFSNERSSNKSSLGFYITGELYNGKHKLSMKLDGQEYSNNRARERGVVVHSADYVSQDFINSNGRIGRSYGCPALPKEDYEETINLIKNGSCFFIYYPEKYYLSHSKIIDNKNNLFINEDGQVITG